MSWTATGVLLTIVAGMPLTGYSLADCHPYNVIFHKGEPKFVDLGAFRPVPPGTRGWKAYESFVQTYLYPLMVWRPGDQYTARLILSYGTGWPHESYLLYQYSSLRWLGSIVRRLGQLRGYAYKGRTLDAYPNDFVLENSPAPLLPLVKRAMALNSKGLLPFQGVHLGRLRRRLESMRSRSYRSEWGGYQDGLFDETGAALPSPRFDGIREELVRLGIDSIVELAGNQGTFCRSLLAEGIVSEATCTDGDDGAIDRLHRENKDRSHAITPAVLDFMNPMGPLHLARPTERFAADAVLALAVIHHLLLKPPFYPIDEVLRVIGEYGHRYVVTEFMPKGLHDGRGAPPLPRWYTLEWFRESFERHFETVTMRPLDEYRTLFIGKKRTG